MPIKTGEQIKKIIEKGMQTLIRQRDEAIKRFGENEYGKLLANDIGNRKIGMLDALLHDLEIQDGDKLTGLEILAGMPREEQLLISENCPWEMGLETHCCVDDASCEAHWIEALQTIYTYRNGKWEGEK